MAHIKSTIKEKLVVDTYYEHKRHKHYYHPDCSTCFVTNQHLPLQPEDKPLFSPKYEIEIEYGERRGQFSYNVTKND